MIKNIIDSKILNIYKPIGKTPFEVVQKVKEIYPEIASQKIGYAGRLDPMAHGVLILMVGEECKKRDYYQELSKVYEFKLLLGVETDTYDTLGLIKSFNILNEKDVEIPQISTILKSFEKPFEQSYPPYSSYHVDGKALFEWSREGRIDEITIPTKSVQLDSISIMEEELISYEDLYNQIKARISFVKGDFRQEEILKNWDRLIGSEKNPKKKTLKVKTKLIRIKVEANSGTYVRSIAHEIGQQYNNQGGIAYEILRTSVGKYKIEDSNRLSF